MPYALEAFAEFIAPDKPKAARGSGTTAVSTIAANRNVELTRLAGKFRRAGLSAGELEAALLEANLERCEDPLDEREVRGIARSVGRYPEKAKQYNRTDAGNGELFADLCRDQVRFCPQKQKWLAWDGTRWSEESHGSEHYLAKTVARAIRDGAEEAEDEAAAKAARVWALKSEDQKRLVAMVSRARCEPGISARWTDFDADPFILNVENGTLDLRTGNLRDHDREALCSRLAPVRFVAGARHPVLDAYLDHATGGDREFESFLQRAFGYSLTGDVSAESFFMVIGPGGSGKTTLVEALKEMLGDYAGTVESETYLKGKRAGGPRNDLAALCGLRMVGSSEVEEGRQLSEATVKSITGREKITARFLHKEFFTFMPTAKMWLAANEAPAVSDKDTGIWRRLIRLPFTRIPEKDDPTIKETLTKDPGARSALLAWALQGCLDWQSRGRGRGGLAIPASIATATAAYREESNPLVEFIDAELELGADKSAAVTAVRDAYTRWARGQKVMSPQEFNRRLEGAGLKRGVTTIDGRSVKVWLGAGLTTANKRGPGGSGNDF